MIKQKSFTSMCKHKDIGLSRVAKKILERRFGHKKAKFLCKNWKYLLGPIHFLTPHFECHQSMIQGLPEKVWKYCEAGEANSISREFLWPCSIEMLLHPVKPTSLFLLSYDAYIVKFVLYYIHTNSLITSFLKVKVVVVIIIIIIFIVVVNTVFFSGMSLALSSSSPSFLFSHLCSPSPCSPLCNKATSLQIGVNSYLISFSQFIMTV